MNHNCHGDFFERHGKRWYRCLMDSALLDAAEVGETCPNCERPQRGTEVGDGSEGGWYPDDSETVALQIDLPHSIREVRSLSAENASLRLENTTLLERQAVHLAQIAEMVSDLRAEIEKTTRWREVRLAGGVTVATDTSDFCSAPITTLRQLNRWIDRIDALLKESP